MGVKQVVFIPAILLPLMVLTWAFIPAGVFIGWILLGNDFINAAFIPWDNFTELNIGFQWDSDGAPWRVIFAAYVWFANSMWCSLYTGIYGPWFMKIWTGLGFWALFSWYFWAFDPDSHR
jgi:hypothetical protein